MGLYQSGVLTVGSLVPKEGRHTLPHNCNVPQLDVNPEIPNPSGGTMQDNSVITADLTNRTFGA